MALTQLSAQTPIFQTLLPEHLSRRCCRSIAGDEVLATAILGRLLHHSHVLNIVGRSSRLSDLEQAIRLPKQGLSRRQVRID